MHPKAFSRLKRNYLEYGMDALIPKKPGPKKGNALNKTADDVEDLVVELAINHKSWGPILLSEALLDLFDIKIHQSTVWRLLKRKKVRYGYKYNRIPKPKPQLYCLDEPGIEVQLDGCYPFGRGRKIVCFDAIDDCSR